MQQFFISGMCFLVPPYLLFELFVCYGEMQLCCCYHCHCCCDQNPFEDEVEMPDFNEDDVLGEVAANSTDEETNSVDVVSIEVQIYC